MFAGLEAMIADAIAKNEGAIPNNPHNASLLVSKNQMMRQPGFADGIRSNAQYVEGSASARSGRGVPIIAIFAQEHMRADAGSAVRTVEQAFPVLESFVRSHYSFSAAWIWYGFVIGAFGGNGQVYIEDRGTYEARTGQTRLPHEAMLIHEHAHSYVGSEALTQFLEAYVFNFLRTGSERVPDWLLTRQYSPFDSANVDLAALLDVYQMIGADAMSRGYEAILPHKPPYGSPLTESAKQAFAAVVPEEFRSQVLAKLSAVTF